MQDSYGYLWIGTQDGLNRYDAYNFENFRNNRDDVNSLSNNYIWTVFEDTDSIIWIGTFGGGLNKFDPRVEKFTHYKAEGTTPSPLTNDRVFEITEHPAGVIWIGTNNGLNRLDKRDNSIKQYDKILSGEDGKEPTNLVRAISPGNEDELWYNSNSGLSLLNLRTGYSKHFTIDPFTKNINLGNTSDLTFIDNTLFVLCDEGLVRLNFSDSTSSVILSKNYLQSIAGNDVTLSRMFIDGDNICYVGSTKGLFTYNLLSKKLNFIQNENSNPNSLSDNSILAFYKSTDNVLWIGTQSGLNKIVLINNRFELLKPNHSSKQTFSGIGIGPVIEDRFGYLWLGTRNEAKLNLFDKANNRVKVFNHSSSNKSSISANYILSIMEDSKGNIWAGTKGNGLNKINHTRNWNERVTIKQITPHAKNSEQFNIDRVQTIYESRDGYIWLGTGGGGLCRYNSKTNSIKSYPYSLDGSGPNHTFVFSILEDSKNNFWIGTATGGINLMNRQSGRFIYFTNDPADQSSLSNNLVLSVYESTKGTVWVGTAGGLNKLETPNQQNLFDSLSTTGKNLSFKRFGALDGFPNEVIYGILEDEAGYLWMSTNKGVVKFDQETDKVIATYDVSDGLQNNEFNQNGFFKNKNGTIYFSGIGGLNVFEPSKLVGNQFIPPIVITSFKLFNKFVPLFNDKATDAFSTDKHVSYLSKLELDYAHKVFSFEFSALNFISSSKNEYAYMMEGFDEDWIYSGNARSVTYTNLDPGNYTFKVKGSNDNGVWNNAGKTIAISIAPPPWLSWYAYLFYAAFFFNVLFMFIRFREKEAKRELEVQNKINEAKLEEREEVRKKSSADFHDEAGNKLTKIALITELARKEAVNNSSLQEYLNGIEENTKELSSGMRDFIWVLDSAKESLYDTVNRLIEFGTNLFMYAETRFVGKGLSEKMKEVPLSMESRRAFILIFKEAMNNCVKYSRADKVEMVVSMNKDKFEIYLQDNGIGFNTKNKTEGYGLINMRNRAEKLGYEIKIDSTEGNGAKITVKCKIPHLSD